MSEHLFYVATNGSDRWSGTLPEPNADHTDGPFASIIRARDRVRELKRRGDLTGAVTVQIRGGRYPLSVPLLFTGEDNAPVTYMAYPDEQPVFDGGTRITSWRVEQVNGRTAWVTDVPKGQVYRQLWVNGERRPRARLPKVTRETDSRNFYRIPNIPDYAYRVPYNRIPDYQIGSFDFYTNPGDMQNFKHLQDVEIVAVHRWIEERLPVKSFDPQTNLVTSTRCSMFRLALPLGQETPFSDTARYYIDNVFEGLTEPGEWYLEREAGRLYYLPKAGESPETAEVYGARLTQLLKIHGKPEQPAQFLRFVGLTFEHAEWAQTKGGWWENTIGDETDFTVPDYEFGSSPQGAVHVPGTIHLQYARNCVFDRCTVRHVGWYGFELADGCVGNRITHCAIHDLGGGGVHISGGNARSPESQHTAYNHVTDNHIYDGGIVFHSGIGILSRHSYGNVLAHNHIHHFFYSGISCGWVWGFAENISRDNTIEYNHIHDLGFTWLDDMGGVYMLGVQPGTVVRNNLVHDVNAIVYGGWAIYTDEGSSHIHIENNIGYRTSHEPFHQHYGRENVIVNNIWAFGGESQIAISRVEAFPALTFMRNIVVTNDQPVYIGGYANTYQPGSIKADLNLFWSANGCPVVIGAVRRNEYTPEKALPFDQWQARGFDRHSIVADPKFKDLANGDFTLAPDSPALELGFKPIDVSGVGVRKAHPVTPRPPL